MKKIILCQSRIAVFFLSRRCFDLLARVFASESLIHYDRSPFLLIINLQRSCYEHEEMCTGTEGGEGVHEMGDALKGTECPEMRASYDPVAPARIKLTTFVSLLINNASLARHAPACRAR